MIYLANWCPNCSWWLLPLMFGAWLLGWLLWSAFRGGKFRSQIDNLKSDLSGLRHRTSGLETDLEKAKFDYGTIKGKHSALSSNFAALETKNKTWEAKYNNIIASGGNIDADEKIADLEAQLKATRDTNTQMETEFRGLKERYGDLESRMQSTGGTPTVDTSNYDVQIADLKQQLEAAHLANAKLKTEFTTWQSNYEVEKNNLISQNDNSNVSDNSNDRISELETQVSIYKNSNAEYEANYADLKSKFGALELKLEAARNAKVDTNLYDTRIEQLKKQLDRADSKSAKLKSEYDALKIKYDEAATLKVAKVEAPKKKKKKRKPAVVKEDDLTLIEGIGPKIESILKEGGIKNFKILARTPTPKLAKLLTDAGPRYRMHNPGTWAQQALFAAQGKWDELKEWQDKLDGGR